MTEIMLRDASKAYDFTYTALRYFNVAGADPRGRTGQSTIGATHLIKVAGEAALGKRSHIDVFGTDYPTRDGTCVRDYIHVSDLANAHLKALERMRAGGGSIVANCGYGEGFSVLEVLETVKKVHGKDFDIRRYHDFMLSGGSIPIALIERRADRFISTETKTKPDGKRGG